MTPRSIIRVCQEKSIDMIAICDHNTAENVKGVRKAAEGTGLTVLAGMEVTTAEEVHLLALFDETNRVEKLQDEVYAHLLPGENDENLFGIQVVANELDEVESVVNRLLIGGTTLTLEDVIDTIHGLGGLAIASHIDRESYSLVGQLGMIPDDLAVDALEVSPLNDIENIRREIPGASRFPLVASSDAHRLDDIGKVMTTFLLEEATLEEIGMALKNIKGRRILKGETSSC
jgi:predicted metal-dependent phosphoesterase TrpH